MAYPLHDLKAECTFDLSMDASLNTQDQTEWMTWKIYSLDVMFITDGIVCYCVIVCEGIPKLELHEAHVPRANISASVK